VTVGSGSSSPQDETVIRTAAAAQKLTAAEMAPIGSQPEDVVVAPEARIGLSFRPARLPRHALRPDAASLLASTTIRAGPIHASNMP
jgi:hypothetical protein